MGTPFKYKLIASRTKFVHKLSGNFMPVSKPNLFTGPGASLQLCQVLPYHGYKKVMVVTDSILVQLGIIEPIKKCLEENGLETVIFSEVEPDPTDTLVVKGSGIFNNEKCDCVLAVGGGSSIDAAKTIASLSSNPGMSVKDLSNMVKAKRRSMPIYCIPSTSGTGSEVSPAAVISDAVTHEKTIVGIPGMMPKAAAIDTNIIKGMPQSVTAPTGLDALTHAIEAYISRTANNESDYYAKTAIKIIFENLPKAYANGDDLKARELMGIAAFNAGYAFSLVFLGYVHSISHRLSKHYGTPHGLANALVLPHVLDFSKDDEYAEERLAQLGLAIGEGESGDANEKLAQAFIDRVYALNKEVGIPDKLDKLQKDDIPEIAKAALAEAHFIYAVPKYMNQQTCEEVVSKLLPA